MELFKLCHAAFDRKKLSNCYENIIVSSNIPCPQKFIYSPFTCQFAAVVSCWTCEAAQII